MKSALLPESLPVFPLSGVILLPHGRLPLNIFEPRYLAMIEEALGHGRLVGVIQPANEDQTPAPLYQVGCAGRIASFSETEDGRFLIQLSGVCRFRVKQETFDEKGYRRVQPLWDDFLADMKPLENDSYDKKRLLSVLRPFFKAHGVTADWQALQSASGEEVICSLAMMCPLPANEKQALLEAPTLHERAELLVTLLEMACLHQDDQDAARH